MSPRRRSLLIDLDGTLADSLPALRAVYGRFLDQFGALPQDAEFALLNGPPLAEILPRLQAAHHLPGNAGDLLLRYQHLLDEAYAAIAPMAGAAALLEAARTAGYVVGVVTSNCARRTRAWLDRVALAPLVDAVVGGEDCRRGKPHPEPYLLAIARTACAVAASMAVEDSPQGARAARAAGLRTFVLDPTPIAAVPWPEGVERIPALVSLAERLRSGAIGDI